MTPKEIRERRLALGLTPDQLGHRLGVSGNAIRAWERGDRRPWGKNLRRIRAAFGLGNPDEACWCACHRDEHRPEPPRHRIAGRQNRRRWTAEEEATLRRLLAEGLPLDDVARTLNGAHGQDRTQAAVSTRASELGEAVWRVYSGRQVARHLGVGINLVVRWIEDGRLPAVRGVDNKYGQPTRWWRITPATLEAFAERYAGVLFDPSRVTDAALRARAEVAAIRNRRAS